jgi:preprotein translocase subunit YajC
VKTYAIVAAEPQPTPAEGQEQQERPGGGWEMFLLLGGIFVVFYLLLIRPQRKREKQRQQQREEMISNLRKNDHVVTIGGIHGVVTNVGDDEITLRIDDKSDARMRVSRDAISKVVTDEDEGDEKASDEAK